VFVHIYELFICPEGPVHPLCNILQEVSFLNYLNDYQLLKQESDGLLHKKEQAADLLVICFQEERV